jgi:hypothetical protein
MNNHQQPGLNYPLYRIISCAVFRTYRFQKPYKLLHDNHHIIFFHLNDFNTSNVRGLN